MADEGAGGKFGGADAKAVFLRWEKLRLAYNLVVGLVGLAAIAPHVINGIDPSFLPGDAMPIPFLVVGVVLYAAAANFCYFLGPALECYLRWLGLNVPVLTKGLYTAGLLLSILLTALIGLVIWVQMALAGFPAPD